MARIAKSDVHGALQQAAKNILSADKGDGRISRKDMQEKLGELEGTEKALTDTLYRFIDHRDTAPGAAVTQKDVDRTVAYAKEKLIDKYDLNRNGLSQAEIKRMSLTGRLAVRLARELKQAGTPVADGDPERPAADPRVQLKAAVDAAQASRLPDWGKEFFVDSYPADATATDILRDVTGWDEDMFDDGQLHGWFDVTPGEAGVRGFVSTIREVGEQEYQDRSEDEDYELSAAAAKKLFDDVAAAAGSLFSPASDFASVSLATHQISEDGDVEYHILMAKEPSGEWSVLGYSDYPF